MLALALLTVLARAEEPVIAEPSDLPESIGDFPTRDTSNWTVYPATTELTFEGMNVTGQVIGPDGSILHEPRRPKFPTLFHPRELFDDEMSGSIAEIR